jgi:hypothetical protein
MFMSSTGLFDFTLRYQRTPCAKYHVRPLSLLQQEVLYCCDGTVTVADLADATRYSHPEIRAVLSFLSQHGLIKTLPPDPTLFAPMPQASVAYAAPAVSGRSRGFWPTLKRFFAIRKVERYEALRSSRAPWERIPARAETVP